MYDFLMPDLLITHHSLIYSLLTILYLLLRSQTLYPKQSGFRVAHSVRNDSTGFATAALIAWKLIVNNAIPTAIKLAATKSQKLISVL